MKSKTKGVSTRTRRTREARRDASKLLELQQQVADLRMERDEARDARARSLEHLNATARAVGMPSGTQFGMLPEFVFALHRQIVALREELNDARRVAMTYAAASAALAGAEERIASLEATIPLGTADLHARIKELEARSRLEAV